MVRIRQRPVPGMGLSFPTSSTIPRTGTIPPASAGSSSATFLGIPWQNRCGVSAPVRGGHVRGTASRGKNPGHIHCLRSHRPVPCTGKGMLRPADPAGAHADCKDPEGPAPAGTTRPASGNERPGCPAGPGLVTWQRGGEGFPAGPACHQGTGAGGGRAVYFGNRMVHCCVHCSLTKNLFLRLFIELLNLLFAYQYSEVHLAQRQSTPPDPPSPH